MQFMEALKQQQQSLAKQPSAVVSPPVRGC